MNPRQIKFTAEYRKDTNQIDAGCAGCMFDKEPGSVCHEVAAVTAQRGLPNCENATVDGKRVIYVAVEVDERQMDLIEVSA
jgi:hypothetical protein